MYPNNQDFFVIGAIEDAHSPAFRKFNRRSPKKIVFQLGIARLFETEDLTAFWIDSGHNVADGAILARRIHSLKNQQQRIAV